jgi:Tol biopolymer transport system component
MTLIIRLVAMSLVLISAFNEISATDVNCGRIAYGDEDFSLSLIDLDGSKLLQITQATPAFDPAWSPDKQRIVYSSGNTSINIIDTRTLDIQQLTQTDSMYLNPSWSPDGEQIAFASNKDGNWELYVIDSDGSNERRLTNNALEDGLKGLTWTSDGEGIAFVRDVGSVFNEELSKYDYHHIYVIDVNQPDRGVNLTAKIDICSAGEVYYNPRWSVATNQLIVALSCGGDFMDIYLLDIPDNTDEEEITYTNLTQGIFELQAGYRGITWSPDGRRIAFIALINDDNLSSGSVKNLV